MKIISTIKKNSNIVIAIINKPLTENFLFFSMMYLLGMVTTFIQVISLELKVPRINFFTWVFDIYLLCIILCVAPKIVQLILKVIFSCFLYILAIVDAFCVSQFQSRFSSEILNLILDTNQRESSEFIDRYIGLNVMFSSVGIVVLLIIIHLFFVLRYRYSLWKWLSSRINNFSKYFLFLLISVSIIISLPSRCSVVLFMSSSSLAVADNYISNYAFNTPFNNLLFGIKMRQIADWELSNLSEYQNNIKIDTCEYISPEIVLIIGESYIKRHSQLYGYSKSTTPYQVQRNSDQENGHLVYFTDVVSTTNLTSIFFRNAFSFRSVDDNREWAYYSLFPVVFRRAGYQVTFISNQFVKDIRRDVFNTIGGLFLNDRRTDELLFDLRNNESHQFDEGLLADYDSLKRYKKEYNLTIFHLAGQHIDFNKRSPEPFKKFHIDDYANRTDLNESERQMVADYDNATFYNDYVLEQIIRRYEDEEAIVVHLSDHGEECFDDLHRMGRVPGGNYSPQIVKNEFEIPFWIWFSKSYKENHSDIVEEIYKAKDNPFMTDDLPHLLVYLAGIEFSDYIDEKNILSPQFAKNRHRLLNGVIDYDSIMNK